MVDLDLHVVLVDAGAVALHRQAVAALVRAVAKDQTVAGDVVIAGDQALALAVLGMAVVEEKMLGMWSIVRLVGLVVKDLESLLAQLDLLFAGLELERL